jgi:hypothetical protein
MGDFKKVYVKREIGGDPSIVKIGDSINVPERGKQLNCGNYRKLVDVLFFLGRDGEIKKQFSHLRVGDGGEEWYKLTPPLIEFLLSKVQDVLTSGEVLTSSEKNFDSLINIPTVELGEVEPQPVLTAARVNSIQPYSNVEAELPKSAFQRHAKKEI